MDANFLSATAAVLISLLFSYVPKLNTWFASLQTEYKRLIMAGALLLVAGVSVWLACAGLAADFGLSVTCDKPGIIGVVQAFILALAANQATYTLSPDTKSVRLAKATRE